MLLHPFTFFSSSYILSLSSHPLTSFHFLLIFLHPFTFFSSSYILSLSSHLLTSFHFPLILLHPFTFFSSSYILSLSFNFLFIQILKFLLFELFPFLLILFLTFFNLNLLLFNLPSIRNIKVSSLIFLMSHGFKICLLKMVSIVYFLSALVPPSTNYTSLKKMDCLQLHIFTHRAFSKEGGGVGAGSPPSTSLHKFRPLSSSP